MPDKSQPDGILKCEIRELVNRRKDVKALMKKAPPDSDHYKQVCYCLEIIKLGL